MWRFLGRLLLVPIAFVLALAVAGTVLALLGYEYFAEMTAMPSDDPAEMLERWATMAEDATRLAAYTTGASILPAILLVIVGEVAGIRSSIYYVLGAGLSLAALPFVMDLGASGDISETARAALPTFATAGFAGGLTYWLLAGRTAARA
ncbi:MAG: hypothetical protein AAFQ35_04085 [Pseudomonadota bacterium]